MDGSPTHPVRTRRGPAGRFGRKEVAAGIRPGAGAAWRIAAAAGMIVCMTLPRMVSADPPPAPVFRAPAVFTSGGVGQYGIALGDVDSDALLDVAVVNDASDTVTVFRNTGDWQSAEPPQNGFQSYNSNPPGSPKTQRYNLPPYPPGVQRDRRVAIGELDATSDNGPDMVVTMNYLQGFAVFLNTGAGTFGTPTFVSIHPEGDIAYQPVDVAIGDYDNDGKNDIALAVDVFGPPPENPAGRWPGLVVAWGNGTGTYTLGNQDRYQYPEAQTYEFTQDMAVGDLNGSPGLLDVAICGSLRSKFYVFLNTGNPSRPERFMRVGPDDGFNGVQSYGVVAGRFRPGTNEDDLVFTNNVVGTNPVAKVRYFFNLNGQGTEWSDPPTTYDISEGLDPRGIAIGRLNTDSLVDVVTANVDGYPYPDLRGNVAVLLGSGSASDPLVGTPYYYRLHVHPESTKPPQVVVGDVSNDGKDDVVTASRGQDGISVLVQGSPPPP